MIERWLAGRIWSGERRRHGGALRAVLREWRPAPGRWGRDEELLDGLLGLLWQGATVGDLARWLEVTLDRRHGLCAAPEEIRSLAERLVAAYEVSLGPS